MLLPLQLLTFNSDTPELMKKLLGIILVASAAVACNSSDKPAWEEYAAYREANNAWLIEQQQRTNPDGTPYYTMVRPAWIPGSYVLMHFFGDPSENAENLSPLYTSTVDVRYRLYLYDGTPADSSDLVTSTGTKGVYRAALNSLIPGWAMALSEMHCGDSAEIIVPYDVAYGSSNLGTILPYSNLRFNVRLVDIPYYELAPYE